MTAMAPKVRRWRGTEAGRMGDDAEALAHGERGHDGGLLDAEHRQRGGIAQGVQAGVAEAGNDEAGSVVLKPPGRGEEPVR